jgi:hypothetical protein
VTDGRKKARTLALAEQLPDHSWGHCASRRPPRLNALTSQLRPVRRWDCSWPQKPRRELWRSSHSHAIAKILNAALWISIDYEARPASTWARALEDQRHVRALAARNPRGVNYPG